MTLTINGVDPSTLGAILDSKNSLRVTPARRGGNIPVPLLDGMMFRPGKRYDSASLVLNFLIMGKNPTTKTVTLATPEHHYEKNTNDFLRLVHHDHLTLKHTRKDGSIRQCLTEVTDVMDFTQVSKRALWNKVSLNLTVIGAFWELDTMTTVPAFVLATSATQTLTQLADAEARMSNMVITWGPSTSPGISQGSTGVYVKYDAAITAGRVLNVNTQTGLLTTDGGTAWTPDYSKLVHAGDSRLFSLVPESGGGAPIVTVTHTGGGTFSTGLSVRKKYMTG